MASAEPDVLAEAPARAPSVDPAPAGDTASAGTEPADEAAAAAPGEEPARPRRVGVLVAIALVVLAVDIASKAIVVATLGHRPPGSPPVSLLGGLLKLHYLRNAGAAFSLGSPSTTILFSAIAIGVIVFILRTSRRLFSLSWAISLGLLLGGASGNLTDRIFRSPGPLRGWVIDWIQLPHWPVFNLADSAIVCGGILAVLLSARGIGIEGPIPSVLIDDDPGPEAAPAPAQANTDGAAG